MPVSRKKESKGRSEHRVGHAVFGYKYYMIIRLIKQYMFHSDERQNVN